MQFFRGTVQEVKHTIFSQKNGNHIFIQTTF